MMKEELILKYLRYSNLDENINKFRLSNIKLITPGNDKFQDTLRYLLDKNLIDVDILFKLDELNNLLKRYYKGSKKFNLLLNSTNTTDVDDLNIPRRSKEIINLKLKDLLRHLEQEKNKIETTHP